MIPCWDDKIANLTGKVEAAILDHSNDSLPGVGRGADGA